MTLLVKTPPGREAARRYAVGVVVGELLGLDWALELEDRDDVEITLCGRSGGCLRLADDLLGIAEDAWLTQGSLPQSPLRQWALPDSELALRLLGPTLPLLYGDGDSPALLRDRGCLTLSLDLFGCSFFMLSRYEEAVADAPADPLGRFPAAASAAVRGDFLNRPIVNEYAELLWWCLHRLWPQLERTPRRYQVRPTHDVDVPLTVFGRSHLQNLRSIAADIIRRRHPELALARLKSYLKVIGGHVDYDLYNAFPFLMAEAERRGLTAAFYFITDSPAGPMDGDYDFENNLWVRRLLRAIYARGHEVGLHPSYGSFDNLDQISKELTTLRRVCSAEGIEQSAWGGRQHYLRWKNPQTWRHWEKCGLSYDSSLGYVECFGFRCGICCEYPVFDLGGSQQLQLRERPLVVMDATPEVYGDKRWIHALPQMVAIADACKKVGGDFVFLFHNNRVVTGTQKAAYVRFLERVCAG